MEILQLKEEEIYISWRIKETKFNGSNENEENNNNGNMVVKKRIKIMKDILKWITK